MMSIITIIIIVIIIIIIATLPHDPDIAMASAAFSGGAADRQRHALR